MCSDEVKCVIADQQDTNNKAYMFVDVVNPVVRISKIQGLLPK